MLPPGGPLLLLLAGLVLLPRHPVLAALLLAAGTATLYALSIPTTARWLAARLERDEPPDPAAMEDVQAIVLLGGELRCNTREYGGDTVAAATLERLRYAAHLQRRTGLPLMACGGRPAGCRLTEAAAMAQVLEEDFGVPVRWREDTSRTTRENARQAAALLAADGIGRVLLVSHAWHLRRAQAAFRAAGVDVAPAPTGFTAAALPDRGVAAWLPHPLALFHCALLLHELAGDGFYRLAGSRS